MLLTLPSPKTYTPTYRWTCTGEGKGTDLYPSNQSITQFFHRLVFFLLLQFAHNSIAVFIWMTEEIAPRKQRKEGGGEKIAVHFIPLIKEEQCKIICHFFHNR